MTQSPHTGSLRIGGESLQSPAGSYDVVSPVSGEVIARHPRATSEAVQTAVAAAKAAYEANLDHTPFERAAWCHAIADVMTQRRTELARLLTLEHGKPLAQSLGEIDTAVGGIRWSGDEAVRLGGETIPVQDPSKLVITTRRPCGVFALITPFNFPVNIPLEYLGPTIAAGNAAVWKPSPSTTTVAAALLDCIDAAGVPAGLVNMVTGPDIEPVQTLVSHPDVVGIGFTGGTRAGNEIARLGAGRIQLMELGGNGPLVVLDHADVEIAAAAAASAAFANSGQSCAAAGRILVASSAYDDFVDALRAAAGTERLGDPFDDATSMGPIHTRGIAGTMRAHLDDATDRGARIVTGGGPASEFPTDLYWQPTIVADVPAEAITLAEETFGPLAAVQRVPDDIEAILAAANSGRFGLSGAVFGTDLDQTIAMAGRLRVGQVTINDTSNYWETHLPFGGFAGRSSGIGRVGVRYALEAVTQIHSVSVTIRSDWRS